MSLFYDVEENDDDNIDGADKFSEPSDCAENSDENSEDEDYSSMNNLSDNWLHTIPEIKFLIKSHAVLDKSDSNDSVNNNNIRESISPRKKEIENRKCLNVIC